MDEVDLHGQENTRQPPSVDEKIRKTDDLPHPPSFHLIIDEKLAKELESSSRIIGELEC